MPVLLNEADVRRCLDVASLVPLMRETLAAFSRRETEQPVRSSIEIRPGSRFYGVMPAYVPPLAGQPGALGLKSVAFYPENEATDLPTHLATILLLDPDTGALEAILDGRLITELRTAAVSAVSVDLLARPGAAVLAMLGSGVQARSHLAAIAHVRDLREVRVWSRRATSAERFVREMAGTVPAPLTAAATASDAVRGADLVVTVTSAVEPILRGEWLEPGMHLCVVGSSAATMREVDAEAVVRSRVWVDSQEATDVESGDILFAIAEGRITRDHVIGELGAVAGGAPGRRAADEITMFKSLGLAVEDVATARLVVERARQRGIGTEIAL
jgi:ornithine cyclodeaminase/alanine dehydrogenase-like protein (mu-crystallin family)